MATPYNGEQPKCATTPTHNRVILFARMNSKVNWWLLRLTLTIDTRIDGIPIETSDPLAEVVAFTTTKSSTTEEELHYQED